MTRSEFLKALKRALRDLDARERERYLSDYAELIEDKLETGMSEEASVAELGDISSIAAAILTDAGEQGHIKPKRSPLVICLLVIGSPLWISLLIAAAAIVLALYISLWDIILSLCALLLALAVCVPYALYNFIVYLSLNLPLAIFLLGAGFVLAATVIAAFRPLMRVVKRLASFSGRAVSSVVNAIKKKGSELL